jgi:phosphohistidine phosphatase
MAWHLTLVRHGEARPATHAGGDAARALTLRGRREVRRVAERWGSSHGAPGQIPIQVWTSPLVRAVQTAELFAGAVGHDGAVEVMEQAEPEARLSELFGAVTELIEPAGSVLLVCHEPNVRVLSATLLGDAFMEPFVPGMAVVLSFDGAVEPGAARLVEIIRPSSVEPPGRPSAAFRW